MTSLLVYIQLTCGSGLMAIGFGLQVAMLYIIRCLEK